ncbi:60S ribosomal protein L11 [Mucor velutinosus]|uniref:60S ribosomal protein L11 n=1 Tax=Mucor velutinosus TaxID=708070 RepID=A0AAN7DP35_9FUNG|nr:60S ribosomal protein L11 [Mucor velutinosus]
MSNPASSNAMTTSSTAASSFSNKSCYRLYAGHGNWINLNAKTTQDLLKIFVKGEPCRYQLAAGLFIDIIPNDVDCNSKNIDMVGLMRADLVYEPQMMENHVQQLMSHYIRSLLDGQGIIDAFPPLRQGEDLPIVTSLPTHRHLSLVPSVVGTVRRGPKSTASSGAAQQRKVVSSSSSSSVSMPDDDPLVLSSSSSSSATHDPMSNIGNTSSRKTALNTSGAVTTRRSQLKRGRQNSDNVDSIELISQHHHPKRHMMSLELPNLNTGALAATATTNHSVFNTNNATSLGVSSFMDHTTNHGHGGLVGFHHQQQQHGNSFWLPSYQSSPMPTNSRSSGGGFSFEFGMDFDHTLQQPQHQPHQQQHKQSPTDVLHDYDMSHQMMSNEHDLYSNHNATAAAAAAAAFAASDNVVTHMHHHHHHVDHSHLLNDNQQQHIMTTASSSDTTSLESFVPASPIPTNWLESTQRHQQSRESAHWQHHYALSGTTATDPKTTALTTGTSSLGADDLKKLKFEYNTTVDNAQAMMDTAPNTTATTDAPLSVVGFDNGTGNSDNSNHGNDDSKNHTFLTHVDAPSSSPSSSSYSSPTTTSQ